MNEHIYKQLPLVTDWTGYHFDIDGELFQVVGLSPRSGLAQCQCSRQIPSDSQGVSERHLLNETLYGHLAKQLLRERTTLLAQQNGSQKVHIQIDKLDYALYYTTYADGPDGAMVTFRADKELGVYKIDCLLGWTPPWETEWPLLSREYFYSAEALVARMRNMGGGLVRWTK